MKKLNQILFGMLATVMVAMFAVSCSSPKGGESANYIYDDVKVLASANLQALLDKSELTSREDLMSAFLNEVTSSSSVKQREFIEKILANPSESGIEIKDDIYLFLNDLEAEQGGFAFTVSDKDKLVEAVKMAIDGQDLPAAVEKDGFSCVDMSDIADMVFVYNDKVAFILPEAYMDESFNLSDYICLDASKSVVNKEVFKTYKSKGADMAMFMSLDLLVENERSLKAMIPGTLNPADFYVYYNLLGEKGKLTVKGGAVAASDEWKKFIEENSTFVDKISGKYLGYFEKDGLGFLALNIDGKKYFDMLMQVPELSQQLQNGAMGLDLEKLASSLKGEVMLGVNSFDGLPDLLLCAEVQDESLVETMNMFLGGQATENGCYTARVQGMFPIYYGVVDGTFFVTMNQKMAAGPQKADKSLKDAEYAGDCKGNYGYIGINVENIMNLSVMGMVTSDMNPAGVSILNQIKYVEVKGLSRTEGEMIIYTKDDSKNFYKLFVDALPKL